MYKEVSCYLLQNPNLSTAQLKVKESHNRPSVAQRVPGGLGSQISWHLACVGGEVSLTHRLPLPPGMFLVLIFSKGWVDPRAMERSEGDMSLKNPVTPPGIDPGTVWIVAQRLNHYAIAGPHSPINDDKSCKMWHRDDCLVHTLSYSRIL
jgi:hypothetical protein